MPIATKSSRINISKESKTKLIAEEFSKNLISGDILLLNGELGVGKTTFVKYLINSFQINFKKSLTEIPSPTFNIVNEYNLEKITIKHFDFYRISDEKELENLGIFEDNRDQIILIEWPKIIVNNHKLKNSINLLFEYEEDYKKRFITFSSTRNISFLDVFK
tara:strand:+ start:170 stop:655 length:486 start_codon:yes stop_codon:yes gene_type:complete